MSKFPLRRQRRGVTVPKVRSKTMHGDQLRPFGRGDSKVGMNSGKEIVVHIMEVRAYLESAKVAHQPDGCWRGGERIPYSVPGETETPTSVFSSHPGGKGLEHRQDIPMGEHLQGC